MCVRNGGNGDDDTTTVTATATNSDNDNLRVILATSSYTSSNDKYEQQEQELLLDDEWEEWDGKSPFLHHCVAGSLAGVAEHTLVYPLDTVRTHIQVCAACHNMNNNGHNTSTSPLTKALSATTQRGGTTNNTSILQRAAGGGGGGGRGVAAAVTSTTVHSGSGGGASVHSMSMLQALRQLVAAPPPQPTLQATTVVEGGTAATSTTTTTTVASAAESIVGGAGAGGGAGISRLWRGVQTVLVGCIPAHALYFSTYEIIKKATLDTNGNVTTYGSALAGAAAVVSHDLILGPLDTVKQRQQLGHYNGLSHAVRLMIQNEGVMSLFRSFPVTLGTNIPYGVVMVGTNEFLKKRWTNDGTEKLTLSVMLGASSIAGFVASATTTPLDRIKTYLQTQQLTPACLLSPNPGRAPDVCPLTSVRNNKSNASGSSAAAALASASTTTTVVNKPLVADFRQAAIRIYQTEGMAGFFRGVTPRVLSHTPAVAISWTTYETAKKYLAHHFSGGTGH